MFFLVLFIITHLSICNTQEVATGDKGYDDAGNSSVCSRCIKEYNELDSYIINNTVLLRELTAAFYRTGKPPTEYVKIIYNFEACNQTGVNNTAVNCTSRQTKFIWSTTVLYLLGPKPLFWLTLFAVVVPEYGITVELPCLCWDEYSGLLDRLTYLVREQIVIQIVATLRFVGSYI